MTPDEAKIIVTHIEAEKIRSSIDFKTYLDSTGLVQTNQDMIKIIHEIVRRDLWYLDFIKEYIPKCMSMNSDFYKLIINISENKNTYRWLEFLKHLHIENPNEARWLIKKLELQKSENIATPLGYLYSGIYLKYPTKIFDIISKSSTEIQKLAYMVAVGIIFEKKVEITASEIDHIINLSNSDSFLIKRTAIHILVRFCMATEKAQNQLISLANIHDDRIKQYIINSMWKLTTTHPDLVNEISIICSETKDSNSRHNIMMLLDALVSSHPSVSEYPLTAIKIIKTWSQENNFDCYTNKSLIFSKTDKISSIHEFMKTWINDEKDRTAVKLVILPSIISRIYTSQKNHIHFVNLLQELDFKDETTSMMICETLKNFLSYESTVVKFSKDTLQDCEKIITSIAQHYEIDFTPDTKINDYKYKLINMIKNIECKNKHDPHKAKENLEKFPTLVEILGKSRLEKILCDPHYPLIKFLSDLTVPPKNLKSVKTTVPKSEVHKQHYSYAMIADIEESLKQLFEKPNDVPRTIKKGLVENGERFYEALSELNAASRLKRRHSIEFNIKIHGGKELDMKTKSKNSEILFEVTRPQGHLGLKYSRSPQKVENRMREKNIIEKIDSQLKYAEACELPIVLIIDKTDSHEIKAEQVLDAFYGTPQLRIGWIDGEVVSEECVRGEDSIYDKNENSHLLSAIILLRRKYDHDDIKINVVGEILLAPAAAYPLSEEVIKDIKLSFDECQVSVSQ